MFCLFFGELNIFKGVLMLIRRQECILFLKTQQNYSRNVVAIFLLWVNSSIFVQFCSESTWFPFSPVQPFGFTVCVRSAFPPPAGWLQPRMLQEIYVVPLAEEMFHILYLCLAVSLPSARLLSSQRLVWFPDVKLPEVLCLYFTPNHLRGMESS